MNKKIQNKLAVLYVFILLVMIASSTFAYFTTIKVSKISPEVDVTAATTDIIMYSSGDPIEINPNSVNMAEGMDHLSDESYVTANYKTSHHETASRHEYNITLNIDKNELVYSTDAKTPEMILQVIDHDDKEYTVPIEGLELVSVDGIYGYDITTASGVYYIAKDYPISAVNENTHLWKFKVTFLNLDESQNDNINKEFNGNIRIESAGGNNG